MYVISMTKGLERNRRSNGEMHSYVSSESFDIGPRYRFILRVFRDEIYHFEQEPSPSYQYESWSEDEFIDIRIRL